MPILVAPVRQCLRRKRVLFRIDSRGHPPFLRFIPVANGRAEVPVEWAAFLPRSRMCSSFFSHFTPRSVAIASRASLFRFSSSKILVAVAPFRQFVVGLVLSSPMSEFHGEWLAAHQVK